MRRGTDSLSEFPSRLLLFFKTERNTKRKIENIEMRKSVAKIIDVCVHSMGAMFELGRMELGVSSLALAVAVAGLAGSVGHVKICDGPV